MHFSPTRSLYRFMIDQKSIDYFSSDFENEFLAEYAFDITDINQQDHSFDLIICYHILEHIEEDLRAMKELFRVLKPDGKIYLQTPFKEGEIYEDGSIVSPEARELHFGQNDHVRIYSAKGLESRLRGVGFKVEIKQFFNFELNGYYGLKKDEIVLIASK